MRAPVFALRHAEKTLLADHLARLVARGVPLGVGMRLLAESGLGTQLLRRHAEVLSAHLDAGLSLSDAMSTMPRSFSDEDVAPIAAGEQAGLLPEVLTNRTRASAFRRSVAPSW